MPRAKAFTPSDIKARAEVTLDPNIIVEIESILKSARVTQPQRFIPIIKQAIETYRFRLKADRQERPAAIVEALKPILALTIQLRKQLDKLPQSTRLHLKIEGPFDELVARIEERSKYWQDKVYAQRPAGEREARLDLIAQLGEFLGKDIAEERKRRQTIAKIFAKAGIRFPDEKKNRRKFYGMKRIT